MTFKSLSIATSVSIIGLATLTGCGGGGGSSSSTTPTTPSAVVYAADGYIIKLDTNASAFCSDTNVTHSTDVVGAKGAITFAGITLTDKCTVSVPADARIDMDNSGDYNESIDLPVGFVMKAPGDAKYVSHITTLAVESGNDKLLALAKTFDPVLAADDAATDSNTSEQAKKLLILGEAIKTVLATGDVNATEQIKALDITQILDKDTNASALDTGALVASLASDFKAAVTSKVEATQDVVELLKELKAAGVEVNDAFVKMSDGGKTLTEVVGDANVSEELNATIQTVNAKVEAAVAAKETLPKFVTLDRALFAKKIIYTNGENYVLYGDGTGIVFDATNSYKATWKVSTTLANTIEIKDIESYTLTFNQGFEAGKEVIVKTATETFVDTITKIEAVKNYTAYGLEFLDRKTDATYIVEGNSVAFAEDVFTLKANKSSSKDSKAAIKLKNLSDTNQLGSVEATIQLVQSGSTRDNRAQLSIGDFDIEGSEDKAYAHIFLSSKGIRLLLEVAPADGSESTYTPPQDLTSTDMTGKTITAKVVQSGSSFIVNISGDHTQTMVVDSPVTLASGIKYAQITARTNDASNAATGSITEVKVTNVKTTTKADTFSLETFANKKITSDDGVVVYFYEDESLVFTEAEGSGNGEWTVIPDQANSIIMNVDTESDDNQQFTLTFDEGVKVGASFTLVDSEGTHTRSIASIEDLPVLPNKTLTTSDFVGKTFTTNDGVNITFNVDNTIVFVEPEGTQNGTWALSTTKENTLDCSEGDYRFSITLNQGVATGAKVIVIDEDHSFTVSITSVR